MKALSAVAFSVFISAGASAQYRAAAPAPVIHPSAISPQRAAPPLQVPSAGALGGRFASVGISRPLGGIAPPTFPATGVQRRHVPNGGVGTGYRYAGPIYYVPNAYDTAWQPDYQNFYPPGNPALNYLPAAGEPNPQQQPIIINQYFGTRHASTQTEDGNSSSSVETVPDAVAPGDPLAAPQRYYLIAYKDHSVYSALAYWVEGDTLHYVTTQNTHNQASLALIDLQQTTKLNADNKVPFSLAGK
jgi:hypothetical protein